MAPTFVRISPSEWVLDGKIRGRRRHQLLRGLGFAGIVSQVGKQATILTHSRKRIRDHPDYYRVEITLRVPPRTVDLFHNSAAGYRAQYYRSAAVGMTANQYAVRRLVPRITKSLKEMPKRTCPLWWVEKSLRNSEAKLWVHQGRWLRSPRKSDQNLLVKRWLGSNPAKRNRRLWVTLTPRKETQIDLKGGPLTLSGEQLTKPLKSGRSKDIHTVGYT